MTGMKINPNILSIPPYISTSWKNIASLHVEPHPQMLVLIVTLHSGARIEVPGLETSMIEGIFSAHALFLEMEEKIIQTRTPPRTPLNQLSDGTQTLSFELPIKGGIAEIQSMGTLLEHNPEQSNLPDLPQEVLEKITQISKTLNVSDPNAMPTPEPHCNCVRCQIARAMQGGIQNDLPTEEQPEEIVSDAELTFKTWDIDQSGDKLYTVTSPLDKREHYSVFLGDPIGCTCGEHHCEHVRAVLNS
jgi:hypothetical protein